MKSMKMCLLVTAFCCMAQLSAQQQFGSAKYTAMCSYYGETISGDIEAWESGPTAESVVEKIMSVIGLKANFELRAANVPNAAAVILKSKRFILYNPKFMDNINSAAGSNWAAISILAHEIGHHLNGHTLDNVGSRPQTELEADEFSGFVLRRMGASLQEAQSAMALIASLKGSHSHPPKRDRLAYIATGWNKAAPAGVTTNTAVAAAKPKAPTTHETPKPRPVVVKDPAPQANDYIVSDAYFITNPKAKYYMTDKGNLLLQERNRLFVIGSLAQSDRNGFKLMFAGEGNNIYISQKGVLVSDSGRKIGYLKSRE